MNQISYNSVLIFLEFYCVALKLVVWGYVIFKLTDIADTFWADMTRWKPANEKRKSLYMPENDYKDWLYPINRPPTVKINQTDTEPNIPKKEPTIRKPCKAKGFTCERYDTCNRKAARRFKRFSTTTTENDFEDRTLTWVMCNSKRKYVNHGLNKRFRDTEARYGPLLDASDTANFDLSDLIEANRIVNRR